MSIHFAFWNFGYFSLVMSIEFPRYGTPGVKSHLPQLRFHQLPSTKSGHFDDYNFFFHFYLKCGKLEI